MASAECQDLVWPLNHGNRDTAVRSQAKALIRSKRQHQTTLVSLPALPCSPVTQNGLQKETCRNGAGESDEGRTVYRQQPFLDGVLGVLKDLIGDKPLWSLFFRGKEPSKGVVSKGGF
jgi:hypothetical protein